MVLMQVDQPQDGGQRLILARSMRSVLSLLYDDDKFATTVKTCGVVMNTICKNTGCGCILLGTQVRGDVEVRVDDEEVTVWTRGQSAMYSTSSS